jgi:hypothetical protein
MAGVLPMARLEVFTLQPPGMVGGYGGHLRNMLPVKAENGRLDRGTPGSVTDFVTDLNGGLRA